MTTTHMTSAVADPKRRTNDPEQRNAVGRSRLAVLVENSPAAQALQRYRQMADDSARTLQLRRQAQLTSGAPDIAPVRQDSQPTATGLPDGLKAGIESLSGMRMDQVRVHYNSDKPAQLQAHAYAQGNDIHVGPGQERHLPHEAWHVVQQAQGRVRPTLQMKESVAINDDAGLEREADAMGAKAMERVAAQPVPLAGTARLPDAVAQLHKGEHGLVPPSTHGRGTMYSTPQDPKSTTKGKRHVVPRKHMTRFERMIDRIGRLLASNVNVHVAVALDDSTLVLSVNQESDAADKKLAVVAAKLKDIVNGDDPLAGDARITDKRRDVDLEKTRHLLEGTYTQQGSGAELNEEVSSQLQRLIAAINAGVISKEDYSKGAVGIYVVPTSIEKSDGSYNMHGELKVTHAIMERREYGQYREENVYVGGTLADCFACNASHKIANEEIQSLLARNTWKFYSGGTHGGLFVGYRASKTVVKHKHRFKALTDEEVSGGDIPKVDVIGKESSSSVNDDSESEADDAAAMSEYAQARNELISARNSLKDSQRKLDSLTRQIAATRKKQGEMATELGQLETLVKTEAYRTKVAKAKENLNSAQAISLDTQAKVTLRIQELVHAQALLDTAIEGISKDKAVAPGRKKNSGIDIEFKEKLGVAGFRLGDSMKEKTLDALDTKYGYSAALAGKRAADKNLADAKEAAESAASSAQQVKDLLEEADGPAGRLAALPDEIEAVKENIEQLESAHADAEVEVGEKEDGVATAKAGRKRAGASVEPVTPRLDWLNEASVSKDAAEDD